MAYIIGKEEGSKPGMGVLEEDNASKPGVNSSAPLSASMSPKRAALARMAGQTKEPQKFVAGGLVEREKAGERLMGMTAEKTGKDFTAKRPESRSGSGTYTNLKKYIDANQPKAQQIGSRISSGIRGEKSSLEQDIAKKREKSLGAGSKISQEQQRLDSAGQFASGLIDQAGATGPSEEDLKRFKAIREGTTSIDTGTGPNLYKEAGKAADLKRRAAELLSSRGRVAELSRAVGKQSPTYTGGQRALDALLISGKRGAQAVDSRGLQRDVSGLDKQTSSLEGDIRSKLAEQQRQRGDIARTATEQLAAKQQGIQSDVASQLEQAQAEQAALRAKVESGQHLSPEEMAKLGADPESIQKGLLDQTFGQKLSDYVHFGNIAEGDVRTAAHAAQLNALRQLAGQPAGDLQAGSGQIATGAQDYIKTIGDKKAAYDLEKSQLEGQAEQIRNESKQVAESQREQWRAYYLSQMNTMNSQTSLQDQYAEAMRQLDAKMQQIEAAHAASKGIADIEQGLSTIDARHGVVPPVSKEVDPTQGGKYLPPPGGGGLKYIPTKG